jgi:tRNA pseudouridine55 synthase
MKGPDGLLVVDKPGGITSRAAVDRALSWFPRGTRMGHTGTLDPLATGVLVLCLGSATRLTEYVQRMAKTYTTRILLGARSDSDDADGTVTAVEGAVAPTEEAVREAVQSFVGTISQVPPAYSAAKVTGQRAYDRARAGKEVRLAARPVQVHGIDVLAYAYPHLDLEVRCGKGTYIRSLARDLGEALGCGGLVEVLRRTRVGPFLAEEGVSLDAEAKEARAKLLPVGSALAELPRVEVGAEDARRLRSGQRIRASGGDGEAAVFGPGGELVAVASWDPRRREWKPGKVFSS